MVLARKGAPSPMCASMPSLHLRGASCEITTTSPGWLPRQRADLWALHQSLVIIPQCPKQSWLWPIAPHCTSLWRLLFPQTTGIHAGGIWRYFLKAHAESHTVQTESAILTKRPPTNCVSNCFVTCLPNVPTNK
jgi:hypothetical protein